MNKLITGQGILTMACMIALITGTASCMTVKSVEGPGKAFRGEPVFDMQQIFSGDRFPNVVVGLDGTILTTWPLKRLVFEGAFAYSSLTAGRPGTATEDMIYLFFEGGPKGGGTMARFNLSWLLQGEPTGDGELPSWIKAAND